MILNTTGSIPSPLLSLKGEKGDSGLVGPLGPPGPAGKQVVKSP